MDPGDHKLTASHGSRRNSDLYRSKQRKLIEKGRFGEALQMDIDDIRAKFDDKYDQAIKEMLETLDDSMKVGLRKD
jgi:filamentous hemagglutinin